MLKAVLHVRFLTEDDVDGRRCFRHVYVLRMIDEARSISDQFVNNAGWRLEAGLLLLLNDSARLS